MIPRSTQRAIFKYWEARDVFSHIAYGECFACNRATKYLQRAHLIPNCSGGDGDSSNLVLLCYRCHQAAPMIGTSKQPMINWINARESYLSWQLRRIAQEVRAIDGMEEMVIASGKSPEELGDKLKEKLKQMDASVHPGGDFTSTLVAAVFEIYKDLQAPAWFPFPE